MLPSAAVDCKSLNQVEERMQLVCTDNVSKSQMQEKKINKSKERRTWSLGERLPKLVIYCVHHSPHSANVNDL